MARDCSHRYSEAEPEASLDPRIPGQSGKHSEPSPEGREGGRERRKERGRVGKEGRDGGKGRRTPGIANLEMTSVDSDGQTLRGLVSLASSLASEL